MGDKTDNHQQLHDLRNALANIKGAARIMEATCTDPKNGKLLGVMQDNCETSLRILGKLEKIILNNSTAID